MANAPQQPISSTITEELVLRDPPLPNGRPSVAGAAAGQMDNVSKARVSANPTEEYVAGALFNISSAFAEALPPYTDDISREFGPDIYDRMMTDPQVAGEVNSLILSALANGVTLTSARPDGDPEKPLADEVQAFCQANLDGMATPLSQVLWDMAHAVGTGHSVAEIVWKKAQHRAGKGQPATKRLMLDRLKVKERWAVAFVVDNRRNVVGLLGNLAGRAGVFLGPPSLVSIEDTYNLLPLSKFAILTFRPKNADPRGTSLLRAAYNPWWLKQQTLAEWHKYSIRFAGMSIVGTTAPDAPDEELTGPDGLPLLDASGETSTVSPEQAMLSQVALVQNGAAIVVPHGAEVDLLTPPPGSGSPFQPAVEYYDKQISKAILSQALATNEGEHSSLGTGGEGQGKDIFDLVAEGLEAAMSGMVRNILATTVEFNYGPDACDLVPNVTLSKVEEADFSAMATAVAALETSGYLDDSQKDELDAKIGLPKRAADWLKKKADALKAATAALKAAPPAVPPPKPDNAQPPK